MRLQAGYASNVGLVRQTNEDSYLLRWGLYAVCDGMGGARAGEIASEMACRGLLEVDPLTADGPVLIEVVKEINRAIAERSGQDASLLGMGTTLTAALAGPDKIMLVHVGDSRAYLLHEGRLRQLTEDHSWVAEMIRRGELTPAEAAIHPHRSVITKALGTERELSPDLVETEVEPGDRLMLCSDGLTGMVFDPEIEEALKQGLGASGGGRLSGGGRSGRRRRGQRHRDRGGHPGGCGGGPSCGRRRRRARGGAWRGARAPAGSGKRRRARGGAGATGGHR